MSTGWFKHWFASRSDLNNNRWEPAADELAIYFNATELKGVATKTLRIPSGCEARVLADNAVKLLNEGEETLENLWDRINSLFAGKHAEILITRRAALAVPFALPDLSCGDLNRINAQLVLRLQVGDVEAFHNHFMRQPGSVNIAQLQALLDAAVRQAVGEFTHKRSRDEVLADAAPTRIALDRQLDGNLKRLLAEFGLALQALESVQWDYVPTADDLEKAADDARRKAAMQRFRQGTIKMEEAEDAATLREREIELLDRITQADTREQAIKRGAVEALEALEAQHRTNRQTREDEQTEWAHFKEIAAIRRNGLKMAEEETQRQQAELGRQQFASVLQMQQLQAAVAQVEFIADAETREKIRRATTDSQLLAGQRANELNQKQHEIQVDGLNFEHEIRKQEKARVQLLEDARTAAEIAALEQTTASNQTKLDAETDAKKRLAEYEDQTRTLDNELRDLRERSEIERTNKKQEAESKLQDMMSRGGLSAIALASVTSDKNQLDAITEIFRIQTMAEMKPEAITAMNGGRQAGAPDKTDAVLQQLTGLISSLATAQKPQQDSSTRELLDYFHKFFETMMASGRVPVTTPPQYPPPGGMPPPAQYANPAYPPNFGTAPPPQAAYAPPASSGPAFGGNYGSQSSSTLPGLHPLDLDVVVMHWPLNSPAFQISFVNDAGAVIGTAQASDDYRRADTYRVMVSTGFRGYLTLIGQGTCADYFLLSPNKRGRIGLRQIDTGSHFFPGELLYDTQQLSDQQRRIHFAPPCGNERVLALLTSAPLFNEMMDGLAPLNENEVVRLILAAHAMPNSHVALAKVMTRN